MNCCQCNVETYLIMGDFEAVCRLPLPPPPLPPPLLLHRGSQDPQRSIGGESTLSSDSHRYGSIRGSDGTACPKPFGPQAGEAQREQERQKARGKP